MLGELEKIKKRILDTHKDSMGSGVPLGNYPFIIDDLSLIAIWLIFYDF